MPGINTIWRKSGLETLPMIFAVNAEGTTVYHQIFQSRQDYRQHGEESQVQRHADVHPEKVKKFEKGGWRRPIR